MDDYLAADTARINSGTPNKSEITKLTMAQLIDRAGEMAKCVVVDPTGQADYKQTASDYNSAYSDRLERFIVRHHLMDQVFKEDQAGLR